MREQARSSGFEHLLRPSIHDLEIERLAGTIQPISHDDVGSYSPAASALADHFGGHVRFASDVLPQVSLATPPSESAEVGSRDRGIGRHQKRESGGPRFHELPDANTNC